MLYGVVGVVLTTHFSRQGFPRKPTFRTSRSSAPAGLSAQADLLRRQDFRCKPNLPRKPDFPRNSPSSPGAPRIALLDSGKPPSRPYLVFPLLYPRTRPPHHPARAGIPNYSEGVITPSPGHPETSASPTWASSRGHRSVPHPSHCTSKTTPDSSELLRPPSRTLRHYNGSFHFSHNRGTVKPFNKLPASFGNLYTTMCQFHEIYTAYSDLSGYYICDIYRGCIYVVWRAH